MLITSVTTARPGRTIDQIVKMVGKYKNKEILIDQYLSKGKLMEAHYQINEGNKVRNAVKVRKADGTFDRWG